MTTMGKGFLRAAVAGLLALGSAGCLEYTVETTLAADGTGVRTERMEFTRNGDLDLSETDLRALTLASPERGWKRSHRVDASGDTTWILERRADVRKLGDWSDPGRSALILGTTPDKAQARLGYVKLGDVVFRSSVQVTVARRSDGTSLVSYRESFRWDQAADALVEFFVNDLDRALAERYPRVTDTERAGIVGLARGRMWEAGEEGVFRGEDQDALIAAAAEHIAAQAVKSVRVRHPEVRVEALLELVAGVLQVGNERAEAFFQEMLPGLNLGFNTNVTYRLTLPGTIQTTNAQERRGNELEWTFSPLGDLGETVEVFAEAVVG